MSQQSARRSSGPSRIAFIQAGWHADIVDQSRVAFMRGMRKRGIPAGQVEHHPVPGAFEIPLRAKLLARTGRYAAIVAAGFVVDGGIYRHDFVASSVIDALMRVQLETEVPIISVVLTPQQYHEHDAHRDFFRNHFLIKGEEAAEACRAVIDGLNEIRSRKRR
jgi:6,7-dimethyl-8-ribityllumazine synthase